MPKTNEPNETPAAYASGVCRKMGMVEGRCGGSVQDAAEPCHTTTVRGTSFHYRVRPLETDFLFTDNLTLTFPNWDVKGCRERHYMEEYVNIPPDEYVLVAAASHQVMEYGVMESDVRGFVESKFELFEDLLLDKCGDLPLE